MSLISDSGFAKPILLGFGSGFANPFHSALASPFTRLRLGLRQTHFTHLRIGLRSRAGLRGPTYATIYGLLAATGMRISEVIALDVNDVDLHHGVITIRRTKFGKSRLLPLHTSTVAALDIYTHHRDRVVVRV